MKLNKVINLQNKEAMTKTITFNELRRLKDSLPDGSTHRIADELGISVETVRNYFGGHNFKDGKSCGIHITGTRRRLGSIGRYHNIRACFADTC